MLKKTFILPLVIAAILFISIAELPYGFYQLMRFIVPILSAIYAYILYCDDEKFTMWMIPNILAVIMWNPILPIYFDKETWVIIDIIFGISQLVLAGHTYIKDNK
jgi:hypothetical protein